MANIGAAVLVLLLPGLSAIAWLPASTAQEQSARRDPLCWLADAAALSIAIDALLAVALLLLGIRLDGKALALLFAGAALVAAAGFARSGGFQRVRWRVKPAAWLLLALVFTGALVAWRLWQARALVLPAWVDSVHHVFLIRRILELGGLPENLLPEIPAKFYYHCGFHVIAALFAAVSRSTPAQAALWFGQVINAWVALSVYRAAYTFQPDTTGRLPRWVVPGLAALLTGFVLQMPAYYLTWGRYTMLTGLILLGPLLAAAWEVWQGGGRGSGARLALLLAGLCITHYLVLLAAALCFVFLFGWGLLRAWRNRAARRSFTGWLLWMAAGLALALPWLVRVVEANLAGMAISVVSPLGQAAASQQTSQEYLRYVVYLLGPRHNHILLILAALGLTLALVRRVLLVPALWGLLLGCLSLPWGLRLLVFRPDHFAILLFFPASMLLAYLLVESALALRLVARRAWAGWAALLLVSGLLLGWGVQQTADILNPTTVFVTQADLRALDWVAENIPADARFYINSVFWQGRSYRGVDGGYWLLPYAGRAAYLPPGIYDIGARKFVEHISQWAEQSTRLTGCTENFWTLVVENQITHLYLREGVGTLQPDMLAGCAGLRSVYAQDGVSIYQIDSK